MRYKLTVLVALVLSSTPAARNTFIDIRVLAKHSAATPS